MKQGLIHRYPSVLEVFYRVSDISIIILTLMIIHALYHRAGNFDLYLYPAIIGSIFFSLAGEINRLYRSWRGALICQQANRIIQAWLVTLMGLFLVGFVTKTSEDFSRVVMGFWIITVPVAIIVWRVILNRFFFYIRKKGRNTRKTAIAGAGDLGIRVAQAIVREPSMGLNITAFYDDHLPLDHKPMPEIEARVKGDLDQLIKDAHEGEVDVVYVVLPLRAYKRTTQTANALAGYPVQVYVVPDIFVFDLLNARMTDVSGIPAFSILDTPYYGIGGWLKRLEDIVVASLVLIVMAVPMAAIAISIKLTSRGPVFFRQRRYGLDNKEILVWKFRTMTVCEQGEDFHQATDNDSRVTRIGRILRRTSLDELPQFFNVLGGSMSVVGPRPHAVVHDHQFRDQIFRYMSRNRIKPGITGWAQVNGWRGETDTREKMGKRVEYDLEYIRNWSLIWDFKIMCRTFWVMVSGKGAV